MLFTNLNLVLPIHYLSTATFSMVKKKIHFHIFISVTSHAHSPTGDRFRYLVPDTQVEDLDVEDPPGDPGASFRLLQALAKE